MEMSFAIPWTERLLWPSCLIFAFWDPRRTSAMWAAPKRSPVLRMVERIFWVISVASSVSFWSSVQLSQASQEVFGSCSPK